MQHDIRAAVYLQAVLDISRSRLNIMKNINDSGMGKEIVEDIEIKGFDFMQLGGLNPDKIFSVYSTGQSESQGINRFIIQLEFTQKAADAGLDDGNGICVFQFSVTRILLHMKEFAIQAGKGYSQPFDGHLYTHRQKAFPTERIAAASGTGLPSVVCASHGDQSYTLKIVDTLAACSP
jgi:hypothetical protein